MKRTVKVAISMPQELLSRVDRVRRRRGETRSQYFRQAAAERLAAGSGDLVESYMRGYQAQPETADEVEAATRSAVAILAAEPWD